MLPPQFFRPGPGQEGVVEGAPSSALGRLGRGPSAPAGPLPAALGRHPHLSDRAPLLLSPCIPSGSEVAGAEAGHSEHAVPMAGGPGRQRRDRGQHGVGDGGFRSRAPGSTCVSADLVRAASPGAQGCPGPVGRPSRRVELTVSAQGTGCPHSQQGPGAGLAPTPPGKRPSRPTPGRGPTRPAAGDPAQPTGLRPPGLGDHERVVLAAKWVPTGVSSHREQQGCPSPRGPCLGAGVSPQAQKLCD